VTSKQEILWLRTQAHARVRAALAILSDASKDLAVISECTGLRSDAETKTQLVVAFLGLERLSDTVRKSFE
jgi:hypothetical protein